jgi:phosphoribosyl 1,2-cyclic phosphodiesterase
VRIRIWGCRGSLATPGRETLRIGGNTTCVEVAGNGTRIILDAGTGIRELGRQLAEEGAKNIDICLTHLHLDHIEGLGFFTPIWDRSCEVHIWGPASPHHSLRERIATYFSPPLFPVHLDDIPSRLVIHDVPDEGWELGPATIQGLLVNHPGPTLGYRLEEAGKVLAYISDHEPALGTDLATADPVWVSGYSVARDADTLMHDAQYTEAEYPERVGWGHSSIAHTIAFARLAKARRLLLFHHDPLHTDAQLDSMLMRGHELWEGDVDCLLLSHEGMELDVS